MPDSALFRQAALDRLASPERLDERLRVPRHSRVVLAALAVLLAALGALFAWLSLP